MAGHALSGRVIVPGTDTAVTLVLDEPLSLWGGLDAETGRITDVHHPQHDVVVSGTMLVMPFGRGSSSASSVLAEAARLGTAPAGFVLREPDEILALGALVAEELYGIAIPIVVIDAADHAAIDSGTQLTIGPDGVTQR